MFVKTKQFHIYRLKKPRALLAATALGVLLAAPALAADHGRIEGRVSWPDGSGMGGVAVALEGSTRAPAITDVRGAFAFEEVAPGTYALSFTLGAQSASESGVEVTAGATTRVSRVLDWSPAVNETLTVYAASRRVERVTDAPAAVSVVTREQIERQASTGQLPKVLESAPAAEITQSGLYDFKFNVRGVNGTVNRRVAVLIDGRDPSFPFLGTQEWASASFPVDDLESVELVRGPASALYGTNAFNGVLNLTTRSPRDGRGGHLRLTAGDLATARTDLRYAAPVGGGWHLKAVGGYHESDDFTRSRNETLEYSEPCTGTQTADCLLLEAAPLALDRDQVVFGGLRFDRELSGGRALVVEGGNAVFEGPAFISTAGRFQLTDIRRPWARLDFATPHWNLLGSYTGRDAEALTLLTGTASFLDSFRAVLELQTRWDFAAGRGRAVGGVSAGREEVDTADPQGVQTLLGEPQDADKRAVFGQIDYALTENLELVVAGRWDDNSLHPSRVSPKAALVWAATPRHTLRLGYAEGFQTPNFPEYFVRVPLAPPLDLSPFEAFCTPSGVDCGFGDPVPLLAVGNEDLAVETIASAEAGYRGVLGRRSLLSIDVYRSEIEDFVHVLIPQLGTRLGRANPRFGPYAPPAALPAETAAALTAALEGALGPFFPFLSNEGEVPLFVLRATVNFGRVETQGLELAFDHSFGRRWALDFNYSWIDFEVSDELPEAPLELNAPEHKFNLGLTYNGDRLSASAFYRWVDEFRWTEGILNGPVPSYGVFNLAGRYQLSETWDVGLHVSNLFDDEHYEVFSGDVMERRAVAHVGFSW